MIIFFVIKKGNSKLNINYRKRGKKNPWGYRIIEKNVTLLTKSGFSTKKEATIDALAEKELIEKSLESDIDFNISLYELWKTWFTLTILPRNLNQKTVDKYKRRGEKIKSYFGNTPARKIKPSTYQAFINKEAQGRCKDNTRRLNSDINKVIKFAQRDKMQIDNFTEDILITGVKNIKKAEEKYIHSIKDYDCIINYLMNNLYYENSVVPYLVLTGFKTGMRLGELTGLTWDCINYETKEIKTYRRYDSSESNWCPPKTETSIRTIPIDDDLISILKKMKLEQTILYSDKGITNTENFLFYCPTNGVPKSSDVNIYIRNMLENLDIEPKNLSATGMRHTYISVLLSHNIDIWIVAKIVGHKDITQITQTYGHVIKEKVDSENEKIRALLNDTKDQKMRAS